MSGQTTSFRRDINALRAWAVASVVLFHFGVPRVSGGFAGVDVFFVISGFLMTGIVARGLESGSFSVWRFYLTRAVRIWPALMLVGLVVMVFCGAILLTEEYRTVGRHVRDSLLFQSNLRYLSEAGYFDSASTEKWLLHTWSLSVEWQFYLLLPLWMWLLARYGTGHRGQAWILAAVGLASLGWCVWITAQDSARAFYEIQSRAWEMLVGGLVYFVGDRCWRRPLISKGLELGGLALMLFSFVAFSEENRWPSYLAIVPVLGTAMVLLANREARMWGGGLAQWLGDRSYSIYLWHWPIYVALMWFAMDQWWWLLAGILLSLLLGDLSYRWVEVASRRYLKRVSVKRASWLLLGSLVVLLLAANWVRQTGVPQRLPEQVAAIEAAAENFNPRRKDCAETGQPCWYGGPEGGPVRAVMLGDSHADTVVTALAASLPQAQDRLYFRAALGCLLVFGAHHLENPACQPLLDWLANSQESLYPGVPLVLVERLSVYLEGNLPSEPGSFVGRPKVFFEKPVTMPDAEFYRAFGERYVATVCELARTRPVYLVRPFPEMSVVVPKTMANEVWRGRGSEIFITLEHYHQRHRAAWQIQDAAQQQCGVTVLDPLPYLCDDQRCYASRDGVPLYSDDDHLNEDGNRLLIPMFKQIFAEPRD